MLAAMRAVIAVSWGLRVPELELDAVSAAVRVRTGELCRAEAHPWHLQPCLGRSTAVLRSLPVSYMELTSYFGDWLRRMWRRPEFDGLLVPATSLE